MFNFFLFCHIMANNKLCVYTIRMQLVWQSTYWLHAIEKSSSKPHKNVGIRQDMVAEFINTVCSLQIPD